MMFGAEAAVRDGRCGRRRRALCVAAQRVLLCVLAWVLLAALPQPAQAAPGELANGDYLVPVALEGGSGRASVSSPAQVHVADGEAWATIEWSSPHYDYMIVNGERYLPLEGDGNSRFEIPVLAFGEPFEVVADTTAMSVPHEISYQLTFSAADAQPVQDGAPTALLGGAGIVVAGAAALVAMRRRLQR